jgi:hypothetical protein
MSTGEAAGGQDDTYGFALEAHPGKSQGRPSTNTGSKPTERDRPARPRLPQGAPVPDGRTVLTAPDAIGRRSGRWERRQRPRRFIPDTNLLERSLGEVKRRTKVIGRFPGETSCLTLVWAVLDLYISHATNGIKFTELERQRLKSIRYQPTDQATPEEVTAA